MSNSIDVGFSPANIDDMAKRMESLEKKLADTTRELDKMRATAAKTGEEIGRMAKAPKDSLKAAAEDVRRFTAEVKSAARGSREYRESVDALAKSTYVLEQHERALSLALGKGFKVGSGAAKEYKQAVDSAKQSAMGIVAAMNAENEARRRSVAIAQQEMSLQQRLIAAISAMQRGGTSAGGGRVAMSKLHSALPGFSTGAINAELQAMISSGLLTGVDATKRFMHGPNAGSALTIGDKTYSQVQVANRETLDTLRQQIPAHQQIKRSLEEEVEAAKQLASQLDQIERKVESIAKTPSIISGMSAAGNDARRRAWFGQQITAWQHANRPDPIDMVAGMSAAGRSAASRGMFANAISTWNAGNASDAAERLAANQQRDLQMSYVQSASARGELPSVALGSANEFKERISYLESIRDKSALSASEIAKLNAQIRNLKNQLNDVVMGDAAPGSASYFTRKRGLLKESMGEISPLDASGGINPSFRRRAEEVAKLDRQERQVNAAMTSLNREMLANPQTVSERMAYIDALKKERDALAADEAAYKSLNEQVKTQENELKKLKGDVVAVTGSHEEMSKSVTDLDKRLKAMKPDDPGWKRANEEYAKAKRNLDKIEESAARLQRRMRRQEMGFFAGAWDRLKSPVFEGKDGDQSGGFAGMAMGQVKTLAATYFGLHQAITLLTAEFTRDADRRKMQFQLGVEGDREVARQAPNLGVGDLREFKLWAQQNQGKIGASTQDILRVAGFTKSMGISDREMIKKATADALKLAVGDVDTAIGLQQIAVANMVQQKSTNFRGSLIQSRQFAESAAGPNEAVFMANVADRLITATNKRMNMEQAMEITSAMTRTFSEQSGDVTSRAMLNLLSELSKMKLTSSAVIDAEKVKVDKQLVEAFNAEKNEYKKFRMALADSGLAKLASAKLGGEKGPLHEMMVDTLTDPSGKFKMMLAESEKTIMSIDEAGKNFTEYSKAVDDNTRELRLFNEGMGRLNKIQTTESNTLNGAAQQLYEEGLKGIDLTGVLGVEEATKLQMETVAELSRASDRRMGIPENEAKYKREAIDFVIKQEQQMGTDSESDTMRSLVALRDGLLKMEIEYDKKMGEEIVFAQRAMEKKKRLAEIETEMHNARWRPGVGGDMDALQNEREKVETDIKQINEKRRKARRKREEGVDEDADRRNAIAFAMQNGVNMAMRPAFGVNAGGVRNAVDQEKWQGDVLDALLGIADILRANGTPGAAAAAGMMRRIPSDRQPAAAQSP